MIFTTEDLIASIKTRALVPISQQTFQDADLIALLNEEMHIGLVPDIQAAKENFFLRSKVVPLVSAQTEYSFPERAIGGAVKGVFYKDTFGNRLKLTERSVMELGCSNPSLGSPEAFYVQGDKIVVTPNPTGVGFLEVWYYCRPSDLVKAATCAKVTSQTVVGATLVVDIDTDLSTTVSNGAFVDFVAAHSPNRLRDIDVTVLSVGTSQITFDLIDAQDAAGISQLSTGDYICLAGKSPVPLIPQELHPILAQMVAARIVEALGDGAKISMVNTKLQEMRRQAITLISNRVEASAAPIKNRGGILGHARGRW